MDDTTDTTTTDAATASREAAGYRRRLREVEAERDQLAARVEHLQHAEVTRLAGEHLQDPTDLWRGDDADLAGFLTDDGTVDPDRVTAAAHQVLAAHPHWRKDAYTLTADNDQGQRGEPVRRVDWAAILSPS